MSNKTERVIDIHFVGGKSLRLHGAHVPPFISNYMKAIEGNSTCFSSVADDAVIIHISKVTFVEEHEIALPNTKPLSRAEEVRGL